MSMSYSHPLFTPDIHKELQTITRRVLNAPVSKERSYQQSPDRSIPIVVSRRASGKSTALIDFIAERILSTVGEKKIAVLTMSASHAGVFKKLFKESYPKLSEPMVVAESYQLRGRMVDELYIEEFFLIKKNELEHIEHIPVIVGIGTIEAPTTIYVAI